MKTYSNATSYPWMRELSKPFRKQAVIAISLGLVSFVSATLLMFASGYLICRTAQPSTTLFMVMVPVALVQVFGIGRPIARYFERLLSHDWVFRITSKLQMMLFDGARRHYGSPEEDYQAGDFLSALNDDIGHLQNLYLRVSFPTIIVWILFFCAAVFGGAFSLMLGIVLLVFGIVATLLLPIGAFFTTRSLRLHAKSLRSKECTTLTDDVMGSYDWILSGRTDEVIRLHEESTRQAFAAEASTRRIVRAFELASACLLGIGCCFIISVSGTSFQQDSNLVNYIAAFALGFFPLVQTCALLPQAFSEAVDHRDAITRISPFVNEDCGCLDDPVGAHPVLPTTMIDGRTGCAPTESIEPSRTHFSDTTLFETELTGSVPIDSSELSRTDSSETALPNSLILNNVTYQYPQGPALESVTLTIPAGQKVAILGKSGAGKSTLANVIRGILTPQMGSIHVGATPMDVLLEHGQNPIGYIPQHPYVFDLTLRDNLTLANPEATDDDLEQALASVGLAYKLSALYVGLDTQIGETGVGFSGGEARRLALAQALLSHFPIIVLDEPFAGIDPETEHALLDTLFDAFANNTLVVITHHLAEIERFDRVIFLEDGRITKNGSPSALAQDDPHFQKLLSFEQGLYQPATS